MGQPAARLTDMHVGPMVTGVVPHVGGPVGPVFQATVLTGGLPQARIGDMAVCTGPPDTILLGAFTVLVVGKPAARLGDSCVHGGKIVFGLPTVLIGEAGSGSVDAASMAAAGPMGLEGQGIAASEMKKTAIAAAKEGLPLMRKCTQSGS